MNIRYVLNIILGISTLSQTVWVGVVGLFTYFLYGQCQRSLRTPFLTPLSRHFARFRAQSALGTRHMFLSPTFSKQYFPFHNATLFLPFLSRTQDFIIRTVIYCYYYQDQETWQCLAPIHNIHDFLLLSKKNIKYIFFLRILFVLISHFMFSCMVLISV